MTFTFYKDNKIDGKFEKPVSEIMEEYKKSELSKMEMPFERKILHFMMTEYGSFDILNKHQWTELYKEKDNEIKFNSRK